MPTGWANTPVTYPEWTKPVEVKNFKDTSLLSSSSFEKLTKVDEGQEITPGGVAIESESFKLETFAKIFPVSRRAYVNDELEVIKNAPVLMGASARQTLEETVWSVLLANPVLSDGIALCHGDHNNLVSGALNVANLDIARAALGKQTSNGVLLNLPATHIIVPKALEGTARTLANQQYPDGSLKVVASAHLDLVSSTAWYLISNVNAPVTVATLQGVPIPMTTMKSNIITDNLDYRVVWDFAVVASEWRSIVKSTGL